jgi:hypothetical protein
MGTNISEEITASNIRINDEGSLCSFGMLAVAYDITRRHILEFQNRNILRHENILPHVDITASVGENLRVVKIYQWIKVGL